MLRRGPNDVHSLRQRQAAFESDKSVEESGLCPEFSIVLGEIPQYMKREEAMMN